MPEAPATGDSCDKREAFPASEAKEEINAKGHGLKTKLKNCSAPPSWPLKISEQFASRRDAFEAEIRRLHKDLNQLKKKTVEDDPRYKQLLAEVKTPGDAAGMNC